MPILNDINNTEAMKKLKNLWVTQQRFFKDVVCATKELCEKTKQSVEPIGYLFEEIEPLLVRQIRVLTTLPWQNTGLLRNNILVILHLTILNRGSFYGRSKYITQV